MLAYIFILLFLPAAFAFMCLVFDTGINWTGRLFCFLFIVAYTVGIMPVLQAIINGTPLGG